MKACAKAVGNGHESMGLSTDYKGISYIMAVLAAPLRGENKAALPCGAGRTFF